MFTKLVTMLYPSYINGCIVLQYKANVVVVICTLDLIICVRKSDMLARNSKVHYIEDVSTLKNNLRV